MGISAKSKINDMFRNIVMQERRAQAMKEGPKKRAALEELEGAVASLREAEAGWNALVGWSEMAGTSMASPKGAALAEAGLALLAGPGVDPSVKQEALEELAKICLARDTPAGWEFCVGAGFDPMRRAREAAGSMGWEGGWTGSETPSWLCLAIQRRSWGMVEALSARPEGVAGAAGGDAPASPWVVQWDGDGDFDEDGDGPQAARIGAGRLAAARQLVAMNPVLALWDVEAEGDSPPVSARAALSAAGFVPDAADARFKEAAAWLALRGSGSALAWCAQCPAPPGPGLDLVEAEEGGRFPGLAIEGGVLRRGKADVAWGRMSEWIDSSLGLGACAAMEREAAFHMLGKLFRGSFPNRAPSADERRAFEAASKADGGVEEAKSRIQTLQGWLIEAGQEGRPGAQAASAIRASLLSCMAAWEALPCMEGKPRRLLKV